MSKKEMIIISALVNAGLLAILFVTAVRTETEEIAYDKPPAPMMIAQNDFNQKSETEKTEIIINPISVAPVDEVDQVLKDFAQETPPLASVESLPESDEPVENEQKLVQVTVKKGDVLSKIAKANGTTTDALKKANNMTNDKLRVGQVLKVPVSGGSKDKNKEIAAAKIIYADQRPGEEANNQPVYYTVRQGDNPSKIAKDNRIKLQELLKLNNLDEEKAKNLKPGDQLRVK